MAWNQAKEALWGAFRSAAANSIGSPWGGLHLGEEEDLTATPPDGQEFRGLYVWNTDATPAEDQLETHEDQDALLDFCTLNGINLIHISHYRYLAPALTSPEKQALFARFNSEAHARSISVYALAGGGHDWIDPVEHPAINAWVQTNIIDPIDDWNSTVAADEVFDGFIFDVEYWTGAFDEVQSLTYLEAYYDYVKSVLPTLPCGSFAAFYLQGDSRPEITFNLKLAKDGEHLMDIFDFIDVGAYRDNATTQIDFAQEWFDYSGCDLFVASDFSTGDPSGYEDETIEWWETQHPLISAAFAAEPAFKGLTIHDYESYLVMVPEADVVFILFGQSLADAVQGTPSLTTTQPYDNEQLDLARTGLTPLIEGLPANSDGESQASAMANTVRELRGEGRYHAIRGGFPGAALSDIEQGSANYNAVLAELTTLNTLIKADGRVLRVGGVLFVHGESDNVLGTADYGTRLATLQDDLQTDIQAIITEEHQDVTIPFFVSQVSSYSLVTTPDATHGNIALQQLEQIDDNALIWLDTKQHWDYAADDLHGINTDYRGQGQKFGQAWYEHILQGNAWQALAPSSVVVTTGGTVVDLTYNVHYPPLQFSTSRVTQRTNEGFELYAPTILGAASITDASIVGADTVRLTVDAALGLAYKDTGAPEIRYAFSGSLDPGAHGGRDNPDSPAGNLTDSDATGYGLNHAAHSQHVLSAGLDPRPTNIATHSFRMNHRNEYVTIPDGPELDFTTKATWSFFIRFRDDTLHNVWVCLRSTATWGWRFWSTGGNRSLVLHLGSAGNTARTTGDLFADDTWYHVWATYDGTQPVHTDRVRIVVDAVEAGLSIGGTLPASVGASTSPVLIGFSANGPDMYSANWAHWPDQTFTDVQAWNSGMVRNPVDFDGTGGVTSPLWFFKPTIADDRSAAGGIINHGSGGSAYDATGTNLSSTDMNTDQLP